MESFTVGKIWQFGLWRLVNILTECTTKHIHADHRLLFGRVGLGGTKVGRWDASGLTLVLSWFMLEVAESHTMHARASNETRALSFSDVLLQFLCIFLLKYPGLVFIWWMSYQPQTRRMFCSLLLSLVWLSPLFVCRMQSYMKKR